MNMLFSFVVAPRKQHIDLEGKWIDEGGMGTIVRTIVKCLDTASQYCLHAEHRRNY